MIEVQVPKDISGYESTLIGPLTARQTVCLAVAAAVEYVYYTVAKTLGASLDTDALICIGIAIAAPILYMAIGKPYGMKPEVYILNYLLPSLLAPKDRPYVTKPTYETMLEAIEQQENEQAEKSGKKNKQTQNKKKKKPNKKLSKQDIMYA